MSPITTHVLDTATGSPAAGLPLRLERQDPSGAFVPVAAGVTNADGRVADLMQPGELQAAIYRLTFETGAYHASRDEESFYPSVTVLFEIRRPEQHYHVPLLLSPFGYSTYRGS